jgi:ABC-type lipoprotein export system ATPase subunit
VLLADEPTGDLDEQNAWAVFELIAKLHQEEHLTSLIATHNLALAGKCDRVVGLEHGVLRTRTILRQQPGREVSASGAPTGEAS